MAADAFGVPCRDVDGAACLPAAVCVEEWQLFEGELEQGFLQLCCEALRAKGCVVEGSTDGVCEAS